MNHIKVISGFSNLKLVMVKAVFTHTCQKLSNPRMKKPQWESVRIKAMPTKVAGQIMNISAKMVEIGINYAVKRLFYSKLI